VSIVIPTKNEEDMLEKCLKSILAQSSCPLETIIVDGGSTDNTLFIAKKYDAKIIKEGEYSSPANARNVGAQNAKGDILLIMDADIMLHRHCIARALELFRKKNVIAIIPTDLNYNHSYVESIQRKWNEGARTSINIGLRNAKVSGLVIFIRKKVFEKVRFNTEYGFGEDDDFSMRLEEEFKGSRILVPENCKVISHHPHTFREFATRYIWWGRTFFLYMAKHFCFRSFLNLSSFLLPILVLLSFFTSLMLPNLRIFSITFFSLFIIKIFIICVRSRSMLFLQFAFFDITRSFFFALGLIQSVFTTQKGR